MRTIAILVTFALTAPVFAQATLHTSKPSWLAAASGTVAEEDWSALAPGTFLEGQTYNGVTYSSNGPGSCGVALIGCWGFCFAAYYGSYWSGLGGWTVTMEFEQPVTDIGITCLVEPSQAWGLEFTVDGATTFTHVFQPPSSGCGQAPAFLGLTGLASASQISFRRAPGSNNVGYHLALLSRVYADTDCNANGTPDSTDIASGTSLDCDLNGVPDECQISAFSDCDANDLLDVCEIDLDPSRDCDQSGTLDTCQIAADPMLDANGDGVLDSCAGGGFVYCSGNPNAVGLVGSLEPHGSPVIADDALTLYGYNLPPSLPAMVIMSRSTNYVNPFGGGAGVLCLGAPIRRFNAAAGFPLQFTSSTGEFSLSPSIGQFPGPNAVLPGEVIHFQVWHREFDPATGLPRSNTTDGISVMFR
jgi:hypothetical protein